MNRPLDHEITRALIYCKHKDGALCNMCAYAKYTGGHCSARLLTDASDRINELIEENRELKENNNEK